MGGKAERKTWRMDGVEIEEFEYDGLVCLRNRRSGFLLWSSDREGLYEQAAKRGCEVVYPYSVKCPKCCTWVNADVVTERLQRELGAANAMIRVLLNEAEEADSTIKDLMASVDD